MAADDMQENRSCSLARNLAQKHRENEKDCEKDNDQRCASGTKGRSSGPV
jgi:hypothetical protein